MSVQLPVTGTGQSSAEVATDQIGGLEYQLIKLFSGESGSTQPASVLATTPGSGDGGLVVRPIASTAHNQAVVQGNGSTSAVPWMIDGLSFSSAQTSATTRASSAESELLAANAARRAAVISNLSTAVELLVGFTTATVSTARANCHFTIPANGRLVIGGMQPDVPLYKGPIRGRLNSTTLTGIAAVIQFTT